MNLNTKVNYGAQFEAQMKDLQNYCKTIRFSADEETFPMKDSISEFLIFE